MIDRVAASLGRRLHEVPVGFKWFVDGLMDGSLGFGGEESAGASLLRRDGTVWTTDKDGIALALLSAEMTARDGRDPGELYKGLTAERHGTPAYERVDAPATPEIKAALLKLAPESVAAKELAGERIESVLTKAPGNGAALGGIKVSAKNGWFAARPSGTENVYKIYAESFAGEGALRRIQAQASELIAGLAGPAKAALVLAALLLAASARATGSVPLNPDRWNTLEITEGGGSAMKSDQIVYSPAGTTVDNGRKTLNTNTSFLALLPLGDAYTLLLGAGGDWTETNTPGPTAPTRRTTARPPTSSGDPPLLRRRRARRPPRQ